MKRSACLMLSAALFAVGSVASRASDNAPATIAPGLARSSSMSDDLATRDLFDRWERVWHEGRYDLIPGCVGETYIRHDQKGDRTVTRDAYAAEIANIRKERPDIRVVVYDHSFSGDRVWFRFAFKWTDAKTGAAQSQAGMQAYRIAD